MLLQYEIYYRKFGIRRITQLLNPVAQSMSMAALPRSAIYHRYSFDPEDLMPDPSDGLYRPYHKKILVSHVTDLTSTEGNPRRLAKPVKTLFRPWHLQNNARFKWSPNPENINIDPQTLLIYNYGLLHETYRYVQMPMTKYYKWKNIDRTIYSNINAIAEKTHKQQFIIKDLPDHLMSVGIMKMFANKESLRMVKLFYSPELLFLLDLWRWIDPVTRPLSNLSVISPDQLQYVNILLRYKDDYAVLNLQKLNDWNNAIQLTTEAMPTPKVKPEQMQRLLLKMIMAIQSRGIDPDPEPSDDGSDIRETDGIDEVDEIDENEDEVVSNKAPEIDPIVPEMDNGVSEIDQRSNAIHRSFKPSRDKHDDKENDDLYLSKLSDVDLDIDEMMKSVDEDLRVIERQSPAVLAISKATDEDVVEDIDILTDESFIPSETEIREIESELYLHKTPDEELHAKLESRVDSGVITAQTYRTIKKQIETSHALKSPKDPTKTIRDYAKVAEEDLVFDADSITMPTPDTVKDPSMAKSTLRDFDRQYTKKVLPKDIQANILSLGKAGIIVKDYQIEDHTSAMGQYEHHIVKIKPLDGADSTLHFRIPKIDDDGNYVANSIKYTIRRQLQDVPIRKISPTEVSLSSYYGKVFIQRCDRKQFDESHYINTELMKIALDGGNDIIKKVVPGLVFDNSFKSPRVYSGLSTMFQSVTTKHLRLEFDHRARGDLVPGIDLKTIEKDGMIVCGITNSKAPILVGTDNMFYIYQDKNYIPLGDIYEITKISSDGPINFTEVKVMGQKMPLGVVLGYYIGLPKLIKLLRAKVRVVHGNKRTNLEAHEYRLRFADLSLILDKRDMKSTQILSGFNFYKDTLKKFDYSQYSEKQVYLLLLEQRGLTIRYLRELENLRDMFIDPITLGVLKDMHEPQTFQGLLVRANELLLTDYHPDSNDISQMRIRGYERVAGLMYREISNAVRDYRNKNISSKSQLSISPYAVWRAIAQDQTVGLAEEINPMANLKEKEIVTYAGSDGRSKDAMNVKSREYHKSGMGIISEGNVDNGDVGVNIYMSANPKLKSLRGLTDTYSLEKDGMSSLLSSTGLLAPFMLHDDPKRAVMIGVQNGHTVACEGYHQPQIRTGYEYMTPYRLSKMYAYMAEQDGKVTELTDHVITVEYKDKSRVGVKIGRHYGKAEGSVYPHDIVTPLRSGSSFKKGDTIAYNTGFFEQDFLDPKRIIMKSSLNAKIAFMETNNTLEDSDSIAPRLTERLKTRIIKERTFVLEFNQSIRNVVAPGTKLTPHDVLFIIEDAITSNTDAFDSDTIEALSRLSNLAPKAKVNGSLDRYEVYYNGDLEDMTPSLRKLATYSDKMMSERTKGTDYHVKSGRVTEEFGVEGKSLVLDTLVIKAYILVEERAEMGDKIVFGNQLKSVISEVMSYDINTESGVPIDGVFSYTSVGKRITISPLLTGTCCSLLNEVARQAVALYKK